MTSANITVLGARGLVGSQLTQTLINQGKVVWCPGRAEEAELFKRPLGTVYYCIGLTADYRERPFDTVEAHVALLARILERADFERLIYLSSTRLYDSLGAVHCAENAVFKLSSADSRHLYDFSKGLGENLCLTVSGGRAKVARLACVLGNHMDDDGFIPSLLKQTKGESTLQVQSSPYFARDYIGLDDVVHLLIQIAEIGQHSVYNVASGNNVSNKQLFELVEKLTGCAVSGTSQARSDSPVIDTQRIKDEFGFVPIALETIMAKILTSGA
jgi:nucleoside-diphosphate-sugar epimerase